MDPQEPKDFDSSQHYTKLKDKLNFFKECKRQKIIPKGFQIHFNVAMKVNDWGWIQRLQKQINLASSQILESFIEITEQDINYWQQKMNKYPELTFESYTML